MNAVAQSSRDIVQDYLAYKEHVNQESYADVDRWTDARKEKVEAAWPEYKATSLPGGLWSVYCRYCYSGGYAWVCVRALFFFRVLFQLRL